MSYTLDCICNTYRHFWRIRFHNRAHIFRSSWSFLLRSFDNSLSRFHMNSSCQPHTLQSRTTRCQWHCRHWKDLSNSYWCSLSVFRRPSLLHSLLFLQGKCQCSDRLQRLCLQRCWSHSRLSTGQEHYMWNIPLSIQCSDHRFGRSLQGMSAHIFLSKSAMDDKKASSKSRNVHQIRMSHTRLGSSHHSLVFASHSTMQVLERRLAHVIHWLSWSRYSSSSQ